MAARSLTMNEMAHVSDGMLKVDSAPRAVITNAPLLAPLLSVLQSAHGAVLETMPKPDDPRMTQLVAEAMKVDAVHDGLVNGVYNLLSALSQLNENDPKYLDLRSYLFPEGIAAATNITYEGQAGYAKRFRSRLTEERRNQLAGISAGARNLLEVTTDWLDAGDRLAAIGEQQQQVQAANQPSPAADIYQARLSWIQAINALRSMSSLANLSEDNHRTLFATLDSLEAKADERVARRRARELETDIEAEVKEALENTGVAP